MSIFKRKKQSDTQTASYMRNQSNSQRVLSSYGIQHLYNQENTYNNVFAYVDTIANKFATITPYAEDYNGNQLAVQPAPLRALYHPNDLFSFREFLKYIASTVLTKPYLDILIWTQTTDGTIKPGGIITANNIIGYTFLPAGSRIEMTDGTYSFQTTIVDPNTGTIRHMTFSRDEVISLRYAISPDDMSGGISPALTVKTWADIDTLISEYERGFFNNGAVPAGIMDIIADSVESYQKTVNDLQNGYRGASKTNSSLYSFRPVDPVTMEPKPYSKFEWHPLQTENNKLDLQTLNSVAHDHLAAAFGVPDMARGLDNGQTYANAEQANISYLENTIRPLCATIWDKFEAELQRITRGGIDYHINYKIVLPQQTDVLNVQAQTIKTLVDAYTELVGLGADPDKTATALNLPQLKGLLTSTPNEQEPSSTQTTHYNKQADNKNRVNSFRQQLTSATREYYKTLINSIHAANTSTTNLNDYINTLLEIMTPEILHRMNMLGIQLADLLQQTADNEYIKQKQKELESLINNSVLTGAYSATLLNHCQHVANETTETVINDIKKLLAQATADGYTQDEINSMFTDYINSHAELLGRTETTAAQSLATLYEGIEWNNHIKYKALKKWVCYGNNPCETCSQLNGHTIPLTESFITGADSSLDDLTVESTNIDCPAHPNCECGLILILQGDKQ